jgi:hypothetical protein
LFAIYLLLLLICRLVVRLASVDFSSALDLFCLAIEKKFIPWGSTFNFMIGMLSRIDDFYISLILPSIYFHPDFNS